MRVVANVVGDRAMLALALGVEPGEAVPTFLERSRRRIPPTLVGRGAGPGRRPHRRGGGCPAPPAGRALRARRGALLDRRARHREGSRHRDPQRVVQPHDAAEPGRVRDPHDGAPAPRADLRSRRGAGPGLAGRGGDRKSSGRARRRGHDHRLRRRRARPRRRAPRGAARDRPGRGRRRGGAGPRRDRPRGGDPAGRARAGGPVRRLHAVLHPGHAEPRDAGDRHHPPARSDLPDHARRPGRGHDTPGHLARGSALRGDRRRRRRRPGGEPHADHPRRAPSRSGSASRASRSR